MQAKNGRLIQREHNVSMKCLMRDIAFTVQSMILCR